jgi:hypothetical protein
MTSIFYVGDGTVYFHLVPSLRMGHHGVVLKKSHAHCGKILTGLNWLKTGSRGECD